jgi:hypothetical protein
LFGPLAGDVRDAPHTIPVTLRYYLDLPSFSTLSHDSGPDDLDGDSWASGQATAAAPAIIYFVFHAFSLLPLIDVAPERP